MDQNASRPGHWLDLTAVGLSGLCLVHCLALPLVVALLPFLAQYSDGHLHLQMLAAVLPLSALALTVGYRRHRDRRILTAGCIAMLLLTIGATVAHAQLGLTADRAFTMAGSLTLAMTHYFNATRARLACAV
jgi:MerC mercury resistance protein